jgi:hypothetical protein
LALLRAAVVHQDLGVAGVGRVAVEHFRRPAGSAHRLGHRRVVDVGEAGAELRVGQEEVPQTRGPRLLLQFLDHRRDRPGRLPQEGGVLLVARLDLVAHELPHLIGEADGSVGMREIHTHPRGSLSIAQLPVGSLVAYC